MAEARSEKGLAATGEAGLPPVSASPWWPALLGLLVVGLLGWMYWPVLTVWGQLLWKDEDVSFYVVLPVVSGYIVYRKWPRLRERGWQPAWWGLGLLAAGFLLYIAGELFQSFAVPAFSLLVTVAGLLWLVGGRTLVWELAFPLFLLVFLIPYEGFFFFFLTLPLQLFSSRLAAGMLSLFGYAVHLQGNIIDLGTRQLNVVAACSGLRYIVNMWALGVIFCYFFQRRLWKVAVLILALVPYAIIGNAVRITIIGIWPIFEKGWWHSSLGLTIFLLGFDYLRLINTGLNRLQPPVRRRKTPGMAPVLPGRTWSRLSPYLLAAVVVVVVGGPLAHRAANAPPVPLQQEFQHFPLTLGAWHGNFVPIDAKIFEVTTADSYFNAAYHNGQGEQVNLWIAYYEHKKRGKSFHSPAVCMTGGGLRTLESREIEVAPGVPATAMLMEQDGKQILVYFWYYQAGRWIAGDYANKFAIAQDILLKQRSDGALIRLDTPVGQDQAAAAARLQAFAHLLLPRLREFFTE